MKKLRKSYYNSKWYTYSNNVRKRDGYKCLKCHRPQGQVVLQVHHKKYYPNLKPWEYSLSDCITLCKGCHANEHNLIEPSTGWTLIAIDDLGALDGICERKGCGTEIRYEHEAYHPNWGYKKVGSSCIEFLTQEDKWLSKEVLKIYTNISTFVHKSIWEEGETKKNKPFLTTKFKHHILRIYLDEKVYGIQVALKERGEKWHEWNEIIYIKNKNVNQAKEMIYIVAKGLTTEKNEEKNLLRNIYKRIR